MNFQNAKRACRRIVGRHAEIRFYTQREPKLRILEVDGVTYAKGVVWAELVANAKARREREARGDSDG